MKNFTLKILLSLTLLLCFTTYGQAEFPINNNPDIPYGLQNKYNITDTKDADVSVLIIANEEVGDWIEDVELKLENTGIVAADTYLYIRNEYPELSLLFQYDDILLFATPGSDGRLLREFLPYFRLGGGIVDAPSVASEDQSGNPTIMWRADNTISPFLTLGTVNDPTHPILDNITSISGGRKSYHNSNGILRPGTEVIAEWSNGEPLVVIKVNELSETTKPRAFLNIFPPSGDVNADLWDVNTDVALLMANALKWVGTNDGDRAKRAVPNITDQEMLIYPNPVKNTVSLVNTSGNSIINLQIADLTGRIITNIHPKSKPIDDLDVSHLYPGTYLLRLQTDEALEVLRFVKN